MRVAFPRPHAGICSLVMAKFRDSSAAAFSLLETLGEGVVKKLESGVCVSSNDVPVSSLSES